MNKAVSHRMLHPISARKKKQTSTRKAMQAKRMNKITPKRIPKIDQEHNQPQLKDENILNKRLRVLRRLYLVGRALLRGKMAEVVEVCSLVQCFGQFGRKEIV